MRKDAPTTNKKSNEHSIELLYRIAKATEAVKDGRELLRIIINETQPVFGFYDIGLAVQAIVKSLEHRPKDLT